MRHILPLALVACGSLPPPPSPDAPLPDAGRQDAGPAVDGGAGRSDGGRDAGRHDAGVDAGCADADRDGYCAGVDCADQDSRAYPGQAAYFATPIADDGGFDFNCDGLIEPAWGTTGLCNSNGSNCIGAGSVEHWLGSTVPACGETRTWVFTCSARPGSPAQCLVSGEQRTQRCR